MPTEDTIKIKVLRPRPVFQICAWVCLLAAVAHGYDRLHDVFPPPFNQIASVITYSTPLLLWFLLLPSKEKYVSFQKGNFNGHFIDFITKFRLALVIICIACLYSIINTPVNIFSSVEPITIYYISAFYVVLFLIVEFILDALILKLSGVKF